MPQVASKKSGGDTSGEGVLPSRRVQFKAIYWNYEHTEEEKLVLHIGGLTAEQETVHCKVIGFTPFVYLELPSKMKWNRAKCQAVFDYFQKILKSAGPLTYRLLKRHLLYGQVPVNTMYLTFSTHVATLGFERKCRTSRSLYIDGVGSFKGGDFKVHEASVDPIMKFTAAQNILLAGWIQAAETILPEEANLAPEERKFSTADIDFYADWTEVVPYQPKETVLAFPSFMSFDIECNSKNHASKIPDPEIPENVVIMIAYVMGRFGSSERRSVLITLFDPPDIPDVTVYRCKTETELLLKWASLINKENPDVFLGYNIMKFDWTYLIERANHLGIYHKFSQISRLLGRKAELRQINWSSSAYKEQKFQFLDAHGRMNLDAILEVERNYRLPQYGLNAVSAFFNLGNKEDMSPREIFMIYQLSDEMLEKVQGLSKGILPKAKRVSLKKQVQKILPMRWCTGQVRSCREKLMKAKTGTDFVEGVREGMRLMGTYCVQDCVLPIRICETLNLWTSMEQTSNCMHVPMSYLHSRGQQIKVLAQVYRETLAGGLVIPTQNKDDAPKGKYQGAIVIQANPCDKKNVNCLDFESLYPSMIIRWNICYTTLLKDSDPTPDSECNVLDWEEHNGCEHDPQQRKIKKEDIRCQHHHYRFRKVVFLPDGTRLHEGLMPRLERRLLTERKVIKKEMAQMEARLKTARGDATEADLTYYAKAGWKLPEKGSLSKKELHIMEVCVTVLNAQQLAMKVSANSAYGAMGAATGFMPLIAGAASVTAMGREIIMQAIKYVLEKHPGDDTGKGEAQLIYGDTDSAHIHFQGLSLAESFDMGDKVSKETTHYLKSDFLGLKETHTLVCPSDKKAGIPEGSRTPGVYTLDKYPRAKISELCDEDKVLLYCYDGDPVNLQFENLYSRYLLLSKKRYIAYITDRKGKVSIIKKGVVLSRRDNSAYLRQGYLGLTKSILDEKTEQEFMYLLYDEVHRLFTRQVPDSHLIIYTGINTVTNYAKHTKLTQGRNVTQRVFLDEDGRQIDDPIGPLDPRLVYPNLPQVLLALKMLRRGDSVPPNTRLEYVYLETLGATHQGEKAEDYNFYRENKGLLKLKPDLLHYLEKQLSKPFTELLRVKYPKPKIPYEPIETAFDRCVLELEDLYRYRVDQIRVHTRDSTSLYPTNVWVGWDAKCRECRHKQKHYDQRNCHKHRPTTHYRTYATRRVYEAKVNYVLESMSRRRRGQTNEIDETKYPELKKICLAWKSRMVLERVYAKYGLRKRLPKRPTQTGEKLRVRTKEAETEVMLVKKYAGYPRLSLGTLKGVEEAEDPRVKKGVRYFYKVLMADGKLLEEVPRRVLTTVMVKDGKIMHDLLVYRGSYQTVVREFQLLCSPLIFEEEKVVQFEAEEQ